MSTKIATAVVSALVLGAFALNTVNAAPRHHEPAYGYSQEPLSDSLKDTRYSGGN